MIIMRLLEGEDYTKDYVSEYAFCIDFGREDCKEELKSRKTEHSEFFRELYAKNKGGILVAEDEAGQVVGWFSFIDKATAGQFSWPVSRQNDDLNRLVGVSIFVNHAKRGLGIGTTLAEELKEVAKEWGYNGVEVACRGDVNPDSHKLNWHTPALFAKAGFQEVERYNVELAYQAEFILMEYIW